MHVSEHGVAVRDLIAATKRAIVAANISVKDPERDLRVDALTLTLHVLAVRKAGGSLDFRIPFLGMQVKVGQRITRTDTHTVTVELRAPKPDDVEEVRAGDIESVLVEAIQTIRDGIAGDDGDDAFELSTGTVQLSFAVDEEGSIAIGFEGELTDELTHTLTLTLVPA